MEQAPLSSAKKSQISDLATRYLWWDAAEPGGHPVSRMIAQIMRLGTYDDILRLEDIVEPAVLADVMLHSAPGWFDDRSWDFWRGRLSVAGRSDIPERRPRRTFAHAEMLRSAV
jgi:hypothetical protein